MLSFEMCLKGQKNIHLQEKIDYDRCWKMAASEMLFGERRVLLTEGIKAGFMEEVAFKLSQSTPTVEAYCELQM